MRSKCGRAKVLGSLICIAGVLVLTLYKGMPLNKPQLKATTHKPNPADQMVSANKTVRWAIGSLLLAAGSLLWSSWFLIQARIGKRYPYQYSNIAFLNLFGAIQSAILSFIIEKDLAMWLFKGRLEILSVIYSVSTLSLRFECCKANYFLYSSLC